MCRPYVNVFFRQIDLNASMTKMRSVVKECARFGKGKTYLGIVLIAPEFNRAIDKSTFFLQEETRKVFDLCLNDVQYNKYVKQILYIAMFDY